MMQHTGRPRLVDVPSNARHGNLFYSEELMVISTQRRANGNTAERSYEVHHTRVLGRDDVVCTTCANAV